VLALTADLLFASRIRATAEAVGVETILVRSADALEKAAAEQRPARIFLDLDARAVDLPALIRRLKETERTADIELIAFVSHVREDAIAAARAAGADQVLPRSVFVRQLPALIAGPARF
jgi:CheY-like chemotaxis protein